MGTNPRRRRTDLYSPAAYDALDDSDNDYRLSVSPPSTPPLTEVSSAHSSAPSSPLIGGGSRRDHSYYESATTIPPPPIIDSGSGGVFGEAAGEWHSLIDDDPYSDVRQRMERLRQMDGIRHGARRFAKDNNFDASSQPPPIHHDITIFAAVTTYLGYVVLIATGHVRDLCASVFRKGRYFRSARQCNPAMTTMNSEMGTHHHPSNDPARYAPLLKSWENFYTRRLYHRIQDCFNRPIASRPGATISVLERVSHDGNKTMSVLGPLSNLRTMDRDGCDGVRVSYRSGEHYAETSDGMVVRRCLNLGSYNYLGFADDWDVTCRQDVIESLSSLPSSVGSCRLEYGTTILHRQVEKIVASFVGKEDAIALNMGFNTNATVIPALASRGDLIVSDELNHTSIVNGARASGAAIRTFRHNDATDLGMILREAIVYGQPRTRRPWNRILVVVEGIYSMEGEYCNFRAVVDACKRYGAYVYLDEAHSIGAMGPTGRGCCEYTGVDPSDVDVLMGTFTKSFGGMGGYVAADKRVIDELRRECSGSVYHNSLSPVVCQQIISSFNVRVFLFVVCDMVPFLFSNSYSTYFSDALAI